MKHPCWCNHRYIQTKYWYSFLNQYKLILIRHTCSSFTNSMSDTNTMTKAQRLADSCATWDILPATEKTDNKRKCRFFKQRTVNNLHGCSISRVPLLTYSITHSTQHSPPWEANRFAACQEIPEGSLPHSQVPATCLYPKPAQSSS
jgi:hypothetical protein